MANDQFLVQNPDEFWKTMQSIGGTFPARWWEDMLSSFLLRSMEMGSGHFSAKSIIESYSEEFAKPGREARFADLVKRMCKHERFHRAYKRLRIAQLEESNHYHWLDDRGNLKIFFTSIGLDKGQHEGICSAHGDKGYQYRDQWEKAGVPFFHGMALLLAGYCHPFTKENRETAKGWVVPHQWVIDNYPRFKAFLPPVDMVDRSKVCPECLGKGDEWCFICGGEKHAP